MNKISRVKTMVLLTALFGLAGLLSGCGDGGSNTTGGSNQSNKALVYLDCDLQGEIAKMEMLVEVLGDYGLTWSSGASPDITGVISTGDYIVYTSGTLQSSTGYYTFSGENQFADFYDHYSYARFLVQWIEEKNGVWMIVNPYGPEPGQHFCTITASQYQY